MFDYSLLREGLETHRLAEWQTPGDATDLLSRMQGKQILKLAWLPSWYASDQSLYRDVWAFYRVFLRASNPLVHIMDQTGVDNIFLSDGMATSKAYKGQTLMLPVSLRMRITAIEHQKLSGIRGVVWGHNMFLVTLDDERCLFLDDEEGAGTCDIAEISPDDWNMIVTAEVDSKELLRLSEHYSQYPLT